jgi:hypothetical protein
MMIAGQAGLFNSRGHFSIASEYLPGQSPSDLSIQKSLFYRMPLESI